MSIWGTKYITESERRDNYADSGLGWRVSCPCTPVTVRVQGVVLHKPFPPSHTLHLASGHHLHHPHHHNHLHHHHYHLHRLHQPTLKVWQWYQIAASIFGRDLTNLTVEVWPRKRIFCAKQIHEITIYTLSNLQRDVYLVSIDSLSIWWWEERPDPAVGTTLTQKGKILCKNVPRDVHLYAFQIAQRWKSARPPKMVWSVLL